HGSKDATSTGEVCTTLAHNVGAVIRPIREDGEIIRTLVRRRRQTGGQEPYRFVNAHKVQAPVRVDVHSVVGLVVKLEGERQSYQRIAVVRVIACVGVTWNNCVRASRKVVITTGPGRVHGDFPRLPRHSTSRRMANLIAGGLGTRLRHRLAGFANT